MIHREANAARAAEACGRHILAVLENVIEGGQRATLAVSGGSSPRPMFAMFAETEFPWERVELFWVDERGVPPTDPQSNFKLAHEVWLEPCGFPKRNIHRIAAELDPGLAARRYTDEIRKTMHLVEGDMPQFDIIHLGMGPEGHTASLFPGEPLIEDRRGLAAAVWVEKVHQWRITLCPGVLLAARHIAMLVTGEDKAQVFKTVLDGPYEPEKYPAQLIARNVLNLSWFLGDEEPEARTEEPGARSQEPE